MFLIGFQDPTVAATVAFPVADPGFCRVRQLQRWALKAVLQPIFPLNLHENEGNWTQSVFVSLSLLLSFSPCNLLRYSLLHLLFRRYRPERSWGLYDGVFHTDLILDSCNCDCLHYLHSTPVVAGVCYAILTRNPYERPQRIKYPPG